MGITPPSPKLVKSTERVKSGLTEARLNFFVNSGNLNQSDGEVIYLPAAQAQLSPAVTPGSTATNGTWTCPAGVTQVQVECYGGGGGGGGGNGSQGGAGGGGGEYACEIAYPVVPGNTYPYTIDTGGAGGPQGQAGRPGGQTIFDSQGIGLQGGVVANGGGGGDTTLGSAGTGGSGSSNRQHASGGAGGNPGTANTGLDNPSLVATQAQMNFWYPLSDAAGSTIAQDDSGNNNVGTPQNVTFGATSPAAPVQVQNITGSQNCAFFPGPSANSFINAGGVKTTSATALTVACWANNANLGYGTSGTIAPSLISNDVPFTTHTGYNLLINTDGKVHFDMGTGSGSVSVISNSSLGASGWNGWHFIVATWDGATVRLYIDGVAQSSTASLAAYHSGANTSAPVIGVNASTGDRWWLGYLANPYVLVGLAMSGAEITAAYGGTPPTGGAGGGASGGSAGAGNIGALGSGSTGGAGGTLAAGTGTQNGSGAGGAGGNSGLSGTAGPGVAPYGGGGGGAGAGSPPAVATLTLAFTASGTYGGPDAIGGNAGVLLNSNPGTGNVGTMTQGGTTNNHGQINGTQIGMMILPSGIAAKLAGATIQSVTLRLATSGFGGGKTALLGYTNNTFLPSSFNGSGVTNLKAFNLGANNSPTTYTYDLTSTTLGSALQSGSATALTFGYSGAPGAYNSSNAANYYLAVFGVSNSQPSLAPQLTVTYTPSAAINGGAGAAGAIAINYINPQGTPICSILDAATTDSGGNQFAAGYTGLATAFQPGTTPLVPETWHQLSLSNSSGSGNGVNGFFYRLTVEGELEMIWDINYTTSAGQTIGTLPAGYRPATQVHVSTGWYNQSNASTYQSATAFNPLVTVNSSGTVVIAGASSIANLVLAGSARIPLIAV